MFSTGADSLSPPDEDYYLGIFADVETRDMVVSALNEANGWECRRRRLPATVVVTLTLMLMLFRSKSIPNVFRKLRAAESRRRPESACLLNVTDEALCHARTRLGSAPLKVLFGKTADKIQPQVSFVGRRAWVIDGTTCDMPDTSANDERFGRPESDRGRAAFPQLKMVVLTCAVTRRVKAVEVLPCSQSETKALSSLLQHLSSGDVLFVDRGLAGYPFLHQCQQRGVDLVMRISAQYKPRVLSRFGVGDYLIEGQFEEPVRPSERVGRRKTRDVLVSARMIVFTFQGQMPVRILTTLFPAEASARALAEGYHLRWEVELGFDELKTHLATVCHGSLYTTFRSKSPDLVLQEFYALLAAYNVLRTAMGDAAASYDLDPLDISFVGALEVLRTAIPYLLLAQRSDWPLNRAGLLREIARVVLKAPRRQRWYPRKVKQKMSNFKLKRLTDTGRLLDYRAAIKLMNVA